MPQDSRPPEPPPDYEIDEEIEHQVNPLADDRNEDVQNALQDIVLFAQDFLDVVDDLEIQPIVPQAIFLPRPVRPALRFMPPAHRGGNFPPPAGPANVMRPPGLFGRQIPGINFVPQLRPGDIPLRPPGLLGRPIRPAGNFRDIARPGHPLDGSDRRQEYGDGIFEGPDDEDLGQAQEVPAEEFSSLGTVDVYPGRSDAGIADSSRPAVMGCEPRRDLAEGVGPSRPLAEGASYIRPAPEEANFSRRVVESTDPSRFSAAGVEPDKRAVMGEESDRSVVMGSNTVRPLLMGTEAVQSTVTGTESEEPSVSMSEQECQYPLPLKRARLDNSEPERTEQSKEDVLDKANEDSSESNGDD